MELTPKVNTLYQHLFTKLKTMGNVLVEEKKTSIHLKNRAGFAGVHPRKEFFLLEIVSDQPLKSERILKSVQVSKSRFHNQVKIETAEDVDDQLVQWLKQAYDLMK